MLRFPTTRAAATLAPLAMMLALALAAVVVTGCESEAERLTEEGEEFYDADELDKALEKYHEAVKVDPTYTRAYEKIAGVYKKRGEYDKALPNYYKAYEIAPEDVDLCAKIAGAHIHNYEEVTRDPADLDKAEAMAEKSLEKRLVRRDPKLKRKLEDYLQQARSLKAQLAKKQEKQKRQQDQAAGDVQAKDESGPSAK